MPVIEEGEDGGRIVFSGAGRSLAEEDQICILSVGVDIGSSTSHLVFSRIVLERLDARYVVTERETFYQSDILLTPYASGDEIDDEALGAFIRRQYDDAMVDPAEIDAGALIAITAADIGARLVCTDEADRIVRIEEAGRRFAADLGLDLKLGEKLDEKSARALAVRMADCLFEAMRGGTPKLGGTGLLRLDPLPYAGKIDEVTFSGGVAEYIFGWETSSFGDLGVLLGDEIRKRMADWNV